MRRTLPIVTCCLALFAISAQAAQVAFSPAEIVAWPSREFAGQTRYRIVDDSGKPVLEAYTQKQASAKYLEQEVDLEATPYLAWCWKVSRVYPGLDETRKSGDDYPARVYLVNKTGLLPWQVQAVNYVWSSNQPRASHWVNAFTDRAQLLAVRGKADQPGRWYGEVRNVRGDFAALFGSSPESLAGVALMSDGDNAGEHATAWFSELHFSSSPQTPQCP